MKLTQKQIIWGLAILAVIALIYGYYNGWFSRWGIGSGARYTCKPKFGSCQECIDKQTDFFNGNHSLAVDYCHHLQDGCLYCQGTSGAQRQIYVVTKKNNNGNGNNSGSPIDILPPIESGE